MNSGEQTEDCWIDDGEATADSRRGEDEAANDQPRVPQSAPEQGYCEGDYRRRVRETFARQQSKSDNQGLQVSSDLGARKVTASEIRAKIVC